MAPGLRKRPGVRPSAVCSWGPSPGRARTPPQGGGPPAFLRSNAGPFQRHPHRHAPKAAAPDIRAPLGPGGSTQKISHHGFGGHPPRLPSQQTRSAELPRWVTFFQNRRLDAAGQLSWATEGYAPFPDTAAGRLDVSHMSQRGFLKLPPGSSLSCWTHDKPVPAHVRERLAGTVTTLLGLTTV